MEEYAFILFDQLIHIVVTNINSLTIIKTRQQWVKNWPFDKKRSKIISEREDIFPRKCDKYLSNSLSP